MTDIDKTCKELARIWKQRPELRLGQLLYIIRDYVDSDMFYTTDEEFIKLAEMVMAKEKREV